MTQHKLLNETLGGDDLEQSVWPSIGLKFKNYEVLWSEFIWPLTNRHYSDRVPHDEILHFRTELMDRQPLLIWFAQAHYTAFRCLASIWFRVNCWPTVPVDEQGQQATLKRLQHLDRLNDVYRLVGSTDDMIGTMAYAIERLEESAGSSVLVPQQKDIKSVQEKLGDWHKKKYTKLYERFVRELKPVTFYIHHRGDGLQRILSNDLNARYKAFRKISADYRNLLHTPHPAQLWRGGEHWVPKPEHLEEFSGSSPS
jgi:hypothetical protein